RAARTSGRIIGRRLIHWDVYCWRTEACSCQMPPTTFGHYRLDTRLGQGGMGEVFRAFDTRLNRPVAVKVMRQTAAVQRFLREARAASALNHPNIVTIH